MRKHWFAGCSALVVAVVVAGCSQDVTPPTSELRALDGLMAREIIEIEKAIPDADFDEADIGKDFFACVKDTPDGDLILRDENPNTPSQPCPPPFQYMAKGSTIKIRIEWFEEDANANGVVCVKETGSGKFIVKDDNLATPSQPCPPAFYVVTGKAAGKKVPFDLAKEADDNFNGQVCLHVTTSGNFVAKDDNFDLPSQPCPPAYSLEPVGKVKPIEPKG